MITEDVYKKVIQYSKKLAKLSQDAEDIAQDAFLSILNNPVKDNKFTKQLYWVITRKAYWRFYYKKDQTKSNYGKRLLCNPLILLDGDLPEIEDPVDLENVICLKTFRDKILKFDLPPRQREVLEADLQDLDTTMYCNLELAHRTFLIARLRKLLI